MKNAPSPTRVPPPERAAPFGVYVHVPWCRRRCPYCDFSFEVGRADGRFPKAVKAELFARRAELPGAPASTLYLGGGTPTHLPDDALAATLDVVCEEVGLAPGAEVTVEANPEDVGEARARALARMGVTRVSLGVQSFDNATLRLLGRAHRGDEAERAVKACLFAGIERVSVDLIAGVPGEPEGRLEEDIGRLAALGVGHVSAYLLTVEPQTPLEKLIQLGKRKPVSEERQADAYEALQALLFALGLRQYEISSFARPGEESRHNRIYWAKGTYLGLGPGAHSMRLLDDGAVVRRHTTARVGAWLEDPAAAAFDEETLLPKEAFREAVAFGLRDLVAGIDLQALAERHRVEVPEAVRAALENARGRDLVVEEGGILRLTPQGARFADAVARDVLTA